MSVDIVFKIDDLQPSNHHHIMVCVEKDTLKEAIVFYNSFLGEKEEKRTLEMCASLEGFKAEKDQTLCVTLPQSQECERIIFFGKDPTPISSMDDIEDFVGAITKALLSTTHSLVLDLRFFPHLAVRDIGRIALDLEIFSHRFKGYKTGDTASKDNTIIQSLTVCVKEALVKDVQAFVKARQYVPLAVSWAQARVCEPANILTPRAFAEKIKELEAFGLEVDILSKAEQKAQGMGAFLGVAQGSKEEAFVAVARWMPEKKSDAPPIVLAGKGVCFDSGGLSLKVPWRSMEGMKADMGGAACVMGTLKLAAQRKASVPIVGIVGLVENSIGEGAQRPGDVVTTMSGKTVEVLNTDAEGRLVLSDIVWYAQERFKPRYLIDVATLTGAVISALGSAYAGLFTHSDVLAQRLMEVGCEENERLWRLPLSSSYIKLLRSGIADLANISTTAPAAVSSVAAHFIDAFIQKDVVWAHLDIAGVGMAKSSPALGASGFGVRLLDGVIRSLETRPLRESL